MRVLKWMLERIDGKAQGVDHIFGVTPSYEDLSWEGLNFLNFTREQFDRITAIDTQAWKEELRLHDELFDLLKQGLPNELVEVKQRLSKRLQG